ncbi:MAG: hypothetical protein GY839_14145 [candidate division Zixibacteria bacterium]|nr:hypothetical protein [candidate division Zixibacteria bacterium]
MSENIKTIEYYYSVVTDEPGRGRRLLEHLSEKSINLISFTAFPIGSGRSQISFIVENSELLIEAAEDAGINLVGPMRALMIQGRDRVGALHDHLLRLANAGINVTAANGVIDGGGRYGFVIWVKQEDVDKAAEALKV